MKRPLTVLVAAGAALVYLVIAGSSGVSHAQTMRHARFMSFVDTPPSLTVEQSSYKPGGSPTVDFFVYSDPANEAIARMTIFSPNGYSSNISQAPGTRLGQAVAFVKAGAIGGSLVPLAGPVVGGNPSDPTIMAAPHQCPRAGPSRVADAEAGEAEGKGREVLGQALARDHRPEPGQHQALHVRRQEDQAGADGNLRRNRRRGRPQWSDQGQGHLFVQPVLQEDQVQEEASALHPGALRELRAHRQLRGPVAHRPPDPVQGHRPRSDDEQPGQDQAAQAREEEAALGTLPEGLRRRSPSAFHRQLAVSRPLVPRARVVARGVAGGPERERGQRRPGAGVAVRDDLGALGKADELPYLLRRRGLSRRDVETLVLEQPRAGDVRLAGIARRAGAARVLLGGAHVEDRQVGVVEPVSNLLPGRHRLEAGLEARLRLLQLDRPGLDLAGPRGDPAGQDRDVRVSGELGCLRR